MDLRRALTAVDQFESATAVQLSDIENERQRLQHIEEENLCRFQHFDTGDHASARRCRVNLERDVHRLVDCVRQLSQIRNDLSPADQPIFLQRLQNVKRKLTRAIDSVQRTVDATQPAKHADFYHHDDASPSDHWGGEFAPPNSSRTTQQQRQGLDELRLKAESVAQQAEAHQKIAQDIGELHDIMHELGAMVNEQSEMVDSIEHNVERAQMDVDHGSRNIKKSVKYNTAKYPLAGGLVGAAVAAGPVGAAIGLKTAAVAAVGGAIAGAFGGKYLRNNAVNETRRSEHENELMPRSSSGTKWD